MNFQNTTALCNHFKYIISMPDLCDVRFLVGEEKIPIYGVKAIMATRSRTFYHLIIKHQKKQEMSFEKKGKKKKTSAKHLTIDVKKYDANVFRKIIQFVHCGSVDITMENVAGLLCGSCQFGLEDLTSACWDFIERCIQADNIHQILVAARQYSKHRIITLLLNKYLFIY
ncbi:hypothetical protein KUTeg_017434 [Tegillarca granosa]|uniref:BTB domain-containing protein n=1 Tax=Tegillarca granosa TaxID=220873 RepID=A0ABQ9EIZ5_TEGGR|nr:hypothetical protein KUTeg_017434 [Tegillarca granosa]